MVCLTWRQKTQERKEDREDHHPCLYPSQDPQFRASDMHHPSHLWMGPETHNNHSNTLTHHIQQAQTNNDSNDKIPQPGGRHSYQTHPPPPLPRPSQSHPRSPHTFPSHPSHTHAHLNQSSYQSGQRKSHILSPPTTTTTTTTTTQGHIHKPPRITLWIQQLFLPPPPRPAAVYFLLFFASLMVPSGAICPYNCTCDDEAYVVRCAPSNIDVLPLTFNPALQQLTMYGTEIHTLDINSFHWYPDLRHVNLSKNMIVQVRPETFRNQQNLEELHLAENSIANITAGMFIGLHNLIVLSLRGNAIESLEGRTFQHLRLLRDLDLSENRIHKLEDEALAGLSNLRVLHLQSNWLHAIPALNLQLVPDLAELSLGGNVFTAVKESDFQSMRTLKDLDLSGAVLEGALSLASFRGLSGLRKLNLENCGLTAVPSISLSNLGQLEELHIGQNLFVTLPTDVLRNNRNLRSLYVSRCPHLVDIEKNVLEHNLHIRKVIITDNPQLTYIAPDALRFLPELKVLDLRNNNLHQISERSASWADIEHWNLEGNPISCNCSVAWLRTLLQSPNSSGRVLCASPRGLAGVPLRSTQITDLACSLNLATLGLVIGVVVSAVVVVIAAVVVVMLYRHHNSCVHHLVKGHHQLGGGQRGRCDQPYTHTHNYHQAHTTASSNPVPVTEL